MRITTAGLLVAALAVAACGKEKRDGGNATADLARDTALAADLREVAADTTNFAEAADVSMRDIPESALPMPPAPRTTTEPERRPAMRGDAVPAPRPTPVPVSAPPVRSAAAAPAPAPEAADEYLLPACRSPARNDQRRCLLGYLARSDLTLDQNYQAEIKRRRQEAGTPAGAPEPETVHRLRVAQRAWLVYRDIECRNRNRGKEGPLWAPMRARCLAEFSAKRAQEIGG